MRAIVRCLFTWQIIMLFVGAAFAQQSRQYAFKRLSVASGLLSNTVSATIQDKQGYIWFATLNGLQRYDGNSFINFISKSFEPLTIPSNHIVSLFLDRKGRLWLTGDNRVVGIFDTKNFTFHKAGVPADNITYFIGQSFFETANGDLLLLRGDGVLLRYIENGNRFIEAPNAIPGPPGWLRNGFAWDPKLQQYWMSADSGIAQYDVRTRHLNYRNHNVDNDPVIGAIGDKTFAHDIFSDSRGRISYSWWPPAEGEPIMIRYDRQSGKIDELKIDVAGYHEVFRPLQQRSGRLWIYGYPFLGEWNDTGKPFSYIPNNYLDDQGIKFDYVYNAYEDRESNVWVSTDNGVFTFNPDGQVFNSYKLIDPETKKIIPGEVECMTQMKDGNYFVGTWGPGLFYFDKDFNPLPLPKGFEMLKLYSIWDMATNPKTGELWMTLQNGGIVVYNQETKKVKILFPEVFQNSTIRQVDEDTSGNLWFGTQSGKLVKWDLKKSNNDPLKGYEVVYKTGVIHKVHFDYQGSVWVSVLGAGLLKFDSKTNKLIRSFTSRGKPGERLFNDAPGDMTYFDDSTLIVSAGCINIINTKTNEISWYSTEDGLPSNSVQSVEKDDDGILWAGMVNGICRIVLDKRLTTYYDSRDGLGYDKFKMAGVHEMKDGRLAFFTFRDFTIFDPKKLRQQQLPPKVYLTGFRLARLPISVDSINNLKRVILKYNNTSIGLTFSGLTFLQQQKIHYYYMLEGVDPGWIRTDRPKEFVYNSLRPGQYIFRVRSENADGVENPEELVLTILVRPPYWETWWFYSLIALMMIGILYLLDKERQKRRRSLQQVRRQIASSLTSDLSTTLNNINVLSEIAKIKADKNIEQSKDFIDQISEKSRHMIEVMDDTLWSIDPRNDNMKQTLLRIKEFTEGVSLISDEKIDLMVDKKVQSLELEMRIRHEIYFFYKETILFITANFKCVEMFVNINKTRGKLVMEVLSECSGVTEAKKTRYKNDINKRIKSLPHNLEVIADARSFSVVLQVEI